MQHIAVLAAVIPVYDPMIPVACPPTNTVYFMLIYIIQQKCHEDNLKYIQTLSWVR